MSIVIAGSLLNHSPSELLKLVKERIEGQATVGTWCTVETQTGLLAVHLDESRCFDGEVYADEAGLSKEVLDQMKEDHRISLGKWVLTNLFEGFVTHHARLQLPNEATAKPLSGTDTISPTSAIRARGEVNSDEQKIPNKKSGVSLSLSHSGKY